MGETENIVRVNISGHIFEISSSLLLCKPDTRLGRLCYDVIQKENIPDTIILKKSGNKTKPEAAFFNRSISAFEAILFYYQTDELHIPNNVCPKAFKKEMDFWDISTQNLDSCCRYKYLEFVDNCEMREKFKSSMKSNDDFKEVPHVNDTKVQRCRAKLWSVLEHNESSWTSTVRVFLITIQKKHSTKIMQFELVHYLFSLLKVHMLGQISVGVYVIFSGG